MANGGASKYLADLPSRGLFSSTVLSSNHGGLRVYVCEHDTSPPEGQLIKTNLTNILIRSLTLNKQKSESCTKDVKGKASTETAKGKRAAESPGDGRVSAKKANAGINSRGSRQEGSLSILSSQKDFQHLTVERLRAILKEKGLSTKGRKDELVARLRADKAASEA